MKKQIYCVDFTPIATLKIHDKQTFWGPPNLKSLVKPLRLATMSLTEQIGINL